MSLFGLVKDFLCRSFSPEEMQSLLSYLAAAQDELQVCHQCPQTPRRDTGGAVTDPGCALQVCGALEVIHSLLKGSPAQEQLFAFLFEPGHVELLFSLLVHREFSDEVRERVFKVGKGSSGVTSCCPQQRGHGPVASSGCPPGPVQDAEVREGPRAQQEPPEAEGHRLPGADLLPGRHSRLHAAPPLPLGAGPGGRYQRPPSQTCPGGFPARLGPWWPLGTAGSVPARCWLSLPAEPPNCKDLVAVVELSHRAELSVRLDICRKVTGRGQRGGDTGDSRGGDMGDTTGGDRGDTAEGDTGDTAGGDMGDTRRGDRGVTMGGDAGGDITGCDRGDTMGGDRGDTTGVTEGTPQEVTGVSPRGRAPWTPSRAQKRWPWGQW